VSAEQWKKTVRRANEVTEIREKRKKRSTKTKTLTTGGKEKGEKEEV